MEVCSEEAAARLEAAYSAGPAAPDSERSGSGPLPNGTLVSYPASSAPLGSCCEAGMLCSHVLCGSGQ